MTFEINLKLLDDCHYIIKAGKNHILLNKNAIVPWFIIVPETDKIEFYELDNNRLNEITSTIIQLEKFILSYFQSDKLNVAQLGNMVKQMHIHVIGRSVDDHCWPNPIWGNITKHIDYKSDLLEDIKEVIGNYF
jgi:diadenosine tetraphosphate (Ap4A) HIT family hydrolase